MKTIQMQTILSQNKDLPSAGQILYAKLIQAEKVQDKVCVDMQGVTTLPSILLNSSIGKFVDENGKDKLKYILTFSNITKAQAERLRDYLQRYKWK